MHIDVNKAPLMNIVSFAEMKCVFLQSKLIICNYINVEWEDKTYIISSLWLNLIHSTLGIGKGWNFLYITKVSRQKQ